MMDPHRAKLIGQAWDRVRRAGYRFTERANYIIRAELYEPEPLRVRVDKARPDRRKIEIVEFKLERRWDPRATTRRVFVVVCEGLELEKWEDR